MKEEGRKVIYLERRQNKSLDGSWWMDTYGLWMENTDVLKIEMITMCYGPMELVPMF
jgi:hypothetical protein